MSPVSRSAGSALVALALLGAGCPQDRTRPVPRPTPAAPRGVIRFGYPVEPPSLNPIEARSPAARDVLRAVLPSFHVVTPDLRYRPSLLAAEPEVELTDARMEVRFRIRDEATWSDGRPITVGDVAFTWRVMTDDDLDVRVGDGFESVLGVIHDGPKEGRLVFEPPYAAWRDLFSAGRFVLPARGAPDDVADWDRGPPVSGGPFVIEEWTRGRSVELRANPNAWSPPAAAGVSVRFVPDPTTAIQLLTGGELDVVAPMLGAAWGHRLNAVPGAEVSAAYGPSLVHLLVDPEDVPRVAQRRKIAEAIDRNRMTDVLLRGAGRGSDGVLSPEQAAAIPVWTRYGEGSPPRIRGGGELTLVYPAGELTELVARYVRGELNRAGADIELVALDADVFWGRWFPQRRFDLALWESRSGPEPWLARWFGADADEHVVVIEDQRLNGTLAQIDRGGPEGASAVPVSQALLAELAVVVPLFQPQVTAGFKGVTGVRANPTADGILWNAERWALTGG